MKSTAEKSSSTAKPTTASPFFAKAGGGDFFAPAVQAKLTVGKEGDKYEQEADAMADKVVRRSEAPDVQGKCEGCEEKDKMQRKPLAESITPFVQRKETEETHTQVMPSEEEKPVQKAEEKEEPAQAKLIQRTGEKEEEKPVQKAEEKEEPAQAKLIQRTGEKEEEKPVQKAEEKEEPAQAKLIQRAEEKEEPVQKAEEKEEEKPVQKAAAKSGFEHTAKNNDLKQRLVATKSGGASLPKETRSFMEPGFGTDLGHVRVHTDGEAAQLSKALSAQAFTHGSHIYFNQGKFNTSSGEGKKLLAHELTHVLQQTGTKTLRRKPSVSISSTQPIAQLKPAQAAPASSAADPAFAKVLKRVKKKAQQDKKHEPAAKKSNEAQAAALAPANDIDSQAKDRQTQKMDAQQPGEFNATAFKAMLMEKINASAPKNMEETLDYKNSGKAEKAKSDIGESVAKEKKQAGAAIEDTAKQAPDSSGIKPKQVAPLPPTPGTSTSTTVGAKDAAPKPKSANEVSLQANKKEMDQQMKDGEVTDHQLKASGEPEFQDALDKKNEAKADADNAPKEYRKGEQKIIGNAQTESAQTSSASLTQMHGGRRRLMGNMSQSQRDTKSKDEQERKIVADTINGFYEKTKTDVEAILSNLDTQANAMFDAAATFATNQFQTSVDFRMANYKAKRYSGLTGGAKWAWDKLTGMPEEVNVFYTEGRDLYLSTMDGLIDKIANFVAFELNRAKTRIATGKQEIATYVAGLKGSLKRFGTEAMNDIQDKFSELEQSVNNKQEDLADALATKYKDNLSKVDASIEEMKAANRGLVDKVVDAVKGIINTIRELKNILSTALAKAASVFHLILDDPGQFMSNFFDGIKLGINNFKANIESHLKEGLMAWAFGEMASEGIEAPASYDAKGIFGMILQVLNLTKANLRKKAVKLFGEPTVKAMEGGVEVIKVIVTEGPAGLFHHMQEHWEDIKEGIQSTIKTFLVEKIFWAGIAWIVGLLNPIAGLIKIIKLIVNVVMFFVNNAKRIATFLAAIIDSVTDAAQGIITAAAAKVEAALKNAIPLAIGFLAAILGISGIAAKIKGFIKRLQFKVDSAVDKVLKKAADLFKKAGGALGFGKKGKEAGGDVKQKAKADLTAKTKTPFKTKEALQSVVSVVLAKYKPEGLKSLNLKEKPSQKGRFLIEAVASPGENVDEAEVLDGKEINSPYPVGTPVKLKEKGDSNWWHGTIIQLLEGGTPKTAADIFPKGKVVAAVQLTSEKKGQTTTRYIAVDRIQATGNSGYVLDDKKPDHDQYEPKNVKKSKVEKDGSYTLSYDTTGGASFTVSVGADGLVKSITGTSLKLKQQAGIDNRGITERSEGFVTNEDLNAAHLIADQFLGSGYKNSANLATTSAHFNQVIMGNIEKGIAAQIRRGKATSFDLTVSVEWGELMNDLVLSRIMKLLPDKERDAVKGDVETFVARVNPAFKRVMNVRYNVVINGVSLPPYRTGPDAWLGIK